MAECKKVGCCAHEPKNTETQQFVDIKDLVTALQTIAQTGVKNFVFQDSTFEKLADIIAKLGAENNYLKKMAAFWSTPQAELSGNSVVFSFGPGNVYVLDIPVGTEEQRAELATQLRAIAEELYPSAVNQKQLKLFAD